MNASAIAVARESTALNLVDPADVPAASMDLSLTQMAYQLIARGSDFASVKEMIGLGKQLEADAAEKAFNVAMAAAQSEMAMVATNMTNSQTKSRYATYDKLDRALRPIYTKHGFALSFDEAEISKPDYVRVVCFVSHIAGHTRTYHRDMPADGKGAKGGDVMTKTHAAGAASSYGMRYILRGIFNVAVGEDDRDGSQPQDAGGAISEQQVAELRDLIEATAEPGKAKAFTTEFLKWANAESLAKIPAARYAECVQAVRASRPA